MIKETVDKRYDWDVHGVFDYNKMDYIEDSHKHYADLLNEYEETIKALTEKNNGLVNLIDFYSNNVKVSLESVTDTLQRITDGLKEVELE